jgi:hypothetical protein
MVFVDSQSTNNMPSHEYRYILNKRPINTTQLSTDTSYRLSRSAGTCSDTAHGQSSVVQLTPTLIIHCINRHSTANNMSCFFTFSARMMALTMFPRRRQQVSRYRCIAPRRAAPHRAKFLAQVPVELRDRSFTGPIVGLMSTLRHRSYFLRSYRMVLETRVAQ